MSRLSKYSATLAGFGVAVVVFAVMFWLIGAERILDALTRADLALVAVVFALMLGWIVAQGLALWVVLDVLSVSMRVIDSILVFAGAAFANNATPFGQAGGEPIAALLISDVSDADYETSLAAIAGADALNFVPSTSIGLLGAAVYATTTTLSRRLRFAVGSVAVFGLVIVVVALVIWRYRDAVEALVVRVATPPLVLLARVVPRVSTPGPERIEAGFDDFFDAIDSIAGDRRGLAVALALSTLGMVTQASAMWLAFSALGATIPVYVPFFVIPVGTMASVGPTPGGLGGIESVHILLLTATTSVGAPVVAAAVVIHRIGGFWLTMIVGGGSMAALQARERLLASG
jgi:uncharacterized protein (TIRG00374 family)